MKKSAKFILTAIGIISVITALFGLWYNGSTLLVAFSGAFNDDKTTEEMPYLLPAFYTMSAVCIICYILLAIFGYQLIRGRYQNIPKFVAVVIFEAVFFFSTALLWLVPNVGLSIGGATGIAMGGLMAQFFILFPLWAPPLAIWGRRQLTITTITEEAEQDAAVKQQG